MVRRFGAVLSAMALAVLPMQARAAQFLVSGSGAIGDGPWVGQNISGPNGALIASLAGMTSKDTYSFSLLVDNAEPTHQYNSSVFSFDVNGVTLLSNQKGGVASVNIIDGPVDFFGISFAAIGVDLLPGLAGMESGGFDLDYPLPANTFNSDDLPTDGSFLSGFSTGYNTFYISSNGSGVSDVFGTSTINITPVSVPEPATWLLLIAGLGLTGGALRLSRKEARPQEGVPT